ncbi:hypothetical protein NBRC116493_09280 [Aurantivibrio infirmus]
MKNYYSWIRQEIHKWQQEGLVSAEQAQLLSNRYIDDGQQNSWGKIIFSAIGAIILGLGVILFFAYNWEAMHRFLKLSTVLSAVAIAHGLGWYFSFNSKHYQKVGESLHLLGTMLFGAGIWLIAQIYHIDEHYPNAILIWSIGSLAMAWVLSSSIHALLAMALLGFWSAAEVFDFDRVTSLAPWIVAFGVLPLTWHKRSKLLLFFSASLFLLLLFFSSINIDGALAFNLLFVVAVGYIGFSKLCHSFGLGQFENILRIIGTIVYVVFLYILCFSNVVDELYIGSITVTTVILYWWLPFVFTFLVWLGVWLKRASIPQTRFDLIDSSFTLFTFLFYSVLVCIIKPEDTDFSLLFNIIFFAHGVLYLLRGMESVRWQQVALGGLMIASLIFARFLDLFDSLLSRSFAFVILGAGLMLVGILFSRQKAKQEAINHD